MSAWDNKYVAIIFGIYYSTSSWEQNETLLKIQARIWWQKMLPKNMHEKIWYRKETNSKISKKCYFWTKVECKSYDQMDQVRFKSFVLLDHVAQSVDRSEWRFRATTDPEINDMSFQSDKCKVKNARNATYTTWIHTFSIRLLLLLLLLLFVIVVMVETGRNNWTHYDREIDD